MFSENTPRLSRSSTRSHPLPAILSPLAAVLLHQSRSLDTLSDRVVHISHARHAPRTTAQMTPPPNEGAPASGAAAPAAAPAAGAAAAAGPKFQASAQADASVELFEKEWALYQKVLRGDYLCHAGLYRAVDAELARIGAALAVDDAASSRAAANGGGAPPPPPPPPPRSLRILDLGCGDAHCLALSLERSGLGARVARYVGVDMSAPAIAVARQNVTRALGGGAASTSTTSGSDQQQQQQQLPSIEFVQGDMLAHLEAAPAASFDLVFASLSLHHLPAPDQKAAAVRLARRALAAGGALVIVDIFLQPEDAGSRDKYFERFVADVNGTYELCSREEKDAVLKHGEW